MNVLDMEKAIGGSGEAVSMGELLERACSPGRATWKDLPDCPGIYAICLPGWTTCPFAADAHLALHAEPADTCLLNAKRNRILAAGYTDILYIGKAGAKTSNLRKRVRELIRFGVGCAKKHEGGEWLWQLEGIHEAQLRMWCCPRGKPERIERKLLEQFRGDHGELPLANRI